MTGNFPPFSFLPPRPAEFFQLISILRYRQLNSTR